MADAGGANVLAFSTGDGLVLVDGGPAKYGDQVMVALKNLEPAALGIAVATLAPLAVRSDRDGRICL